MNTAITVKSPERRLYPETPAPGSPGRPNSHVCTSGGVKMGPKETCGHCVAEETLRLCARMKTILQMPGRPSSSARAALRTLVPSINRVLNVD